MRGSLHDLQLAVGKRMREVPKELCRILFAKLSFSFCLILAQLQANVTHFCSLALQPWGLLSFLAGGLPRFLFSCTGAWCIIPSAKVIRWAAN